MRRSRLPPESGGISIRVRVVKGAASDGKPRRMISAYLRGASTPEGRTALLRYLGLRASNGKLAAKQVRLAARSLRMSPQRVLDNVPVKTREAVELVTVLRARFVHPSGRSTYGISRLGRRPLMLPPGPIELERHAVDLKTAAAANLAVILARRRPTHKELMNLAHESGLEPAALARLAARNHPAVSQRASEMIVAIPTGERYPNYPAGKKVG